MSGEPEPQRLSTAELAAAAGTTTARVEDLVARGVLTPQGPDTFDLADIHRMRVIEAFEGLGVPLEALVEATRQGRATFAFYGDLHPRPSPPSRRPYSAFAASLGPTAARLPMLFAAMGLAEPTPTTHLAIDDEALIGELLDILESTGAPDDAVRIVRLFAEANRRAAEGSVGVYADAAAQLGEDLVRMSPERGYVFVSPWARIARFAPTLAGWLASQHMSRVIDAFSADTTERTLEDAGLIAERDDVPPGIAFVDLTGFTRLSQEAGDEAAAGVALRLGDLARATVTRHDGSLVKLLGDGVLLRFPDGVAAVHGTLDLLAALPAAGLPPGHAGVHAGRVIEREGDVFGRTVNMAARISDVAPPGEVYVTTAIREALDGGLRVEPVEPADLQGIGRVELFRVSREPASA